MGGGDDASIGKRERAGGVRAGSSHFPWWEISFSISAGMLSIASQPVSGGGHRMSVPSGTAAGLHTHALDSPRRSRDNAFEA